MLWQIRLLLEKYSPPPPDLHEHIYFPSTVILGLAHEICLASGMWKEQVLKMYLSSLCSCHLLLPWKDALGSLLTPEDWERCRADFKPQDLRRCMLSHFSCVPLCAMLWTIARQLSVGFSRQEYWSVLPFPSPGDLPNPGLKPASLASPALAGGFFTTRATWEVPMAEPHWAQPRRATSQLTHRDRSKKMLEIHITEFRGSMLCSISVATNDQ